MGYANPNMSITYNFGLIDFGSDGATRIKGPKGRKGRLRDVGIGGNTLFTAVTTPAHIKLGTAATPAAYFDMTMGTLAADATLEASTDQPAAFISRDRPVDTDVKVYFTAPTGGSPAGKGFVSVTIDWF